MVETQEIGEKVVGIVICMFVSSNTFYIVSIYKSLSIENQPKELQVHR